MTTTNKPNYLKCGRFGFILRTLRDNVNFIRITRENILYYHITFLLDVNTVALFSLLFVLASFCISISITSKLIARS